MQYMFFTGKGGVGKTSIACATALKEASNGKRVLLVSTDPASNLSDVLESTVNENVQRVANTKSLFAVNIDPHEASEAYRNRVVDPLKESMSAESLKKIREDLSGACTTEVASFDEFSRFISGEQKDFEYDLIIFDTAPTGHTLRLLELPAAWTNFTEENPDGASCLGPSSALKTSRSRYLLVLNTLRNSNLTTFYIVTRPDHASLKEAARTSAELTDLGLTNQVLHINGVFKARSGSDRIAQAVEENNRRQLESMPAILKQLPVKHFPLLPYNLIGVKKLLSLFDENEISIGSETMAAQEKIDAPFIRGMKELVDSLEAGREHGLIMTMGKGGVGKTIAASCIAVMLAERGHEVLLTTTDPAAHIHDFIDRLKALPKGLSIERIDPKLETQLYMEKILKRKGEGKTEEEKRLIMEDLKSPCTEEVAVFHAFSKAIIQAKRKFVVMDTAPTGHTLLLLDTTGAYHREVMRNDWSAGKISTPYMALQDSSFARIVLVSLPETTPMHEAAQLQSDLKRAGIQPYAWLVNQCLSMTAGISDPILAGRAASERKIIQEISRSHASRVFGIPFITDENLLQAMLDQSAKR